MPYPDWIQTKARLSSLAKKSRKNLLLSPSPVFLLLVSLAQARDHSFKIEVPAVENKSPNWIQTNHDHLDPALPPTREMGRSVSNLRPPLNSLGQKVASISKLQLQSQISKTNIQSREKDGEEKSRAPLYLPHPYLPVKLDITPSRSKYRQLRTPHQNWIHRSHDLNSALPSIYEMCRVKPVAEEGRLSLGF